MKKSTLFYMTEYSAVCVGRIETVFAEVLRLHTNSNIGRLDTVLVRLLQCDSCSGWYQK